MKKLITLVLLFALLALTFTACNEEEIDPCPFALHEHVWESGRNREWEDDIIAIAYYLFYSPRLTPRWEEMYEHFDEELQAYTIHRINTLVYNIPNLTDREIQFSLVEIFAMFGDSLTAAFPNYGGIFPIMFFALNDGFYVHDTIVEYEHLLSSRLLAINGIDIDEITFRFNRIISQSSTYRLRQEMMQGDMNCDYRLEFLGITDGTGMAEFTLMGIDGTVSTYIISTVDSFESFTNSDRVELDRNVLLLWSRPGETYWSEDFPEYNFVYFRLHDFHPPGGRITYLRNVLRRIDNFPLEEAVDRLVIDLRRNPGFGNQITQFNMFDETDKLETIYILIDNRTGYAASMFAYFIRKSVDADVIFVGEPTGSPEFFASHTMRIPFNTQLTNISDSHRTEDLLMIVATGFFIPPTSDRTNVALYPDYFIPLTIEDLIAGRDPVLEFIKSRR